MSCALCISCALYIAHHICIHIEHLRTQKFAVASAEDVYVSFPRVKNKYIYIYALHRLLRAHGFAVASVEDVWNEVSGNLNCTHLGNDLVGFIVGDVRASLLPAMKFDQVRRVPECSRSVDISTQSIVGDVRASSRVPECIRSM